MHRDIKPANFIITDGSDRRFVKLCDFDTSKVYSQQDHTAKPGTQNYQAPELLPRGAVEGKYIYSTKADIYSLGLVGVDLFIFNMNEYILAKTMKSVFLKQSTERCQNAFTEIKETLLTMHLLDQMKRPDSKYLLDKINEIKQKLSEIRDLKEERKVSGYLNRNKVDNCLNLYGQIFHKIISIN